MSTRSMRADYERERKDPYKTIDYLLELYDRMDKLLDKQEAQACDKGPTSTSEDSPWNPQGLSATGRGHATKTERSEGQDS